MLNARKQLLKLAIKDIETTLQQSNSDFDAKKLEIILTSEYPNKLLENLEQIPSKQCRVLNKNMKKKVQFHLQRQNKGIQFTKVYVEKKKRKPNPRQKKKKKAIYIAKQKCKKQEKTRSMVTKIKEENIVVNLSNEEIPDAAYIFLQKAGVYTSI